MFSVILFINHFSITDFSMTSVSLLSEVNDVWFEKWRCDDAECKYQMIKCGTAVADNLSGINQV